MKIGSLNATFQPSKIGTAHGLQITYLKDNSTRNIFVYHEDGKVWLLFPPIQTGTLPPSSGACSILAGLVRLERDLHSAFELKKKKG